MGPLPDPRLQVKLQRLLLEEQDRALGQRAVRAGLLTPAQLEEGIRMAAESGRLADVVIGKGWARREAWDALQADEWRDSLAAPTPIPSEVLEHLGDPARIIDDFVLVAPLGRGGAGEVWKAWDRRLSRWVALKIPSFRSGSRLVWERFQREALAAARLAHPNLVPIYQVGGSADRPYIVMQLVEGQTLEEARPPLRRALEMMRAVTIAVDYAHEHGVIHRDIKPGNIMLDAQGGVWLLDFGLAYLLEGADALTVTGTVTGTPAYMSPEQAAGSHDARGRATDVYALGATLYELATGRPPFEGDSVVELLRKARESDPVPPRKLTPALHPDLETIILKAMEKEPRRRYARAADLAEDLRRHLEDLPIAARPASVTYRLYRRMRKNPLAFGLGAVGAAAALAAVLLWSAGRADREIARDLMRDMAQVRVQSALGLRREGANARMRELMPALESAHAEASRRAPDLAEIDFYMGRMYRALMDDRRALECQEQALRKDPSCAPALYERAILLSKRFGGAAGRTPEENAALQPFQRTIVQDLEALQRALERGSAGPMGPQHVLAVRGIFAYYQGRGEEARRLLTEAVAIDPGLEEAWEVLCRIPQEQAVGSKQPERGVALMRESERLFTEALSHDKGYVPHLVGRGVLRIRLSDHPLVVSKDPSADFQGAEEDLSNALRLGPENHEMRRSRGIVRTLRGQFRQARGEDPARDYAGAEEDLNAALRLAPLRAETWRRRGFLYMERGAYRREQGGDPLPDFQAAEKDYEESLRLLPTLASTWISRGWLLIQKGAARRTRGENPEDDFKRAEESIAEALRLGAEPSLPLRLRGQLHAERAAWRVSRAEDPTREFEEALRDFDEACRLRGDYGTAMEHRAELRAARGEWTKGKGGDPRADYAAAAADYAEAIRLHPVLARKVGARLEEARRKAGHPD